MHPDFVELLLLFSLSLRALLLQGVLDAERQQCLGKTQLAYFHGGCVRASIRCAARTAQPDTLFPGKFGRHRSTVSHLERLFIFLPSLPRRRRSPRRLPPFLFTPLLHFTAMALPSSTKSPSFSCSECSKMQHFLFHL